MFIHLSHGAVIITSPKGEFTISIPDAQAFHTALGQALTEAARPRFEDLTRYDQRMALLPLWSSEPGHTVIGVYPNGTRWGIVLVSPAGTECRTAFDRHTTRSVEQFIETLN